MTDTTPGERNRLARDLADRTDERDATEAERLRLATELGARDAELAEAHVLIEDLKGAYDRVSRRLAEVVEMAQGFRDERDQLRHELDAAEAAAPADIAVDSTTAEPQKYPAHTVTVTHLPPGFDHQDRREHEYVVGNDVVGWTSHQVQHADACHRLPYGRHCWLDEAWYEGPYRYDEIEPGTYQATWVSQDFGDHNGEYSHTDEYVHYERTGDAPEPQKRITVADIAGIAPDWTGDASSVEFVRRQRDTVAIPTEPTTITRPDMNDGQPAEKTEKAPECWCAYGGEGLESVHPQCPIHGTEPTPASNDRELHPCEICAEGPQDCTSCDGTGEDGGGYDCTACYGSGESVPDHCCACGGSPYCNCCTKCGAPCVSACTCPITVQLSDGTTKVV